LFNSFQREPQIIKLRDQIFFVAEQDLLDSNCYFVGQPEKSLLLIDTGNGFNIRRIIREMTKFGLSKDKIHKVFLTHCHLDHIRGLYSLKKLLKTPFQVLAHEIEAAYIERGTDELIVPLKGSFGPLIGSLTKLFAGIRPIKVDNKLKDGDIIKVADLEFRVIHTPGHSAGSCCLYEENLKVLFSGDVVYRDGYFGPVNLQTGSLPDLLNSLERLSRLDVELLCPGHSPPVITNGSWHIQLAYKIVKGL
jgi:hydroxyacylglutathione hydrolase